MPEWHKRKNKNKTGIIKHNRQRCCGGHVMHVERRQMIKIASQWEENIKNYRKLEKVKMEQKMESRGATLAGVSCLSVEIDHIENLNSTAVFGT